MKVAAILLCIPLACQALPVCSSPQVTRTATAFVSRRYANVAGVRAVESKGNINNQLVNGVHETRCKMVVFWTFGQPAFGWFIEVHAGKIHQLYFYPSPEPVVPQLLRYLR